MLAMLWTSSHGNCSLNEAQSSRILEEFPTSCSLTKCWLILTPTNTLTFRSITRISLNLSEPAGLQSTFDAVTYNLDKSGHSLTQLTDLIDCKALHDNYLNAKHVLCENVAFGLHLILYVSLTAPFVLIFMLWENLYPFVNKSTTPRTTNYIMQQLVTNVGKMLSCSTNIVQQPTNK